MHGQHAQAARQACASIALHKRIAIRFRANTNWRDKITKILNWSIPAIVEEQHWSGLRVGRVTAMRAVSIMEWSAGRLIPFSNFRYPFGRTRSERTLHWNLSSTA